MPRLISPIFSKLDDANPRVRAAAIVAMGRMEETRAAKQLPAITLSASASGAASAPRYNPPQSSATEQSNATGTGGLTPRRSPESGTTDAWRKADPDRVIPHLAVNALVELNAIDACLEALNGPFRAGAIAALKSMHDPKTIDGLFNFLSTSRDESLRREIWTTLIRLYHREGEFTVDSPKWWGTRPDTTGPYYDRQKWSESDRIAAAILHQLPHVRQRTAAEGPHLVDIGKRYKRAELLESILQPSKKLAQGFDTWAFAMDDGKVYTGFVVLESAETVTVRDATGISRELLQNHIEDRVKQEISIMPLGIVGNLSPEQLADLIAHLESLH